MSIDISVAGGEWLTFTSLRHDGDELLVAPEDLPTAYRVHGARAGITFLHPWANRIGTRATGVPVDANGLPIHGLPGDWSIAADAATMTFDGHPLFPWPHEMVVRWSVEGDTLHVSSELRAPDPVPLTFGWHPYFHLPGVPRRAWMLDLPRRRHFELDALGLPTGASSEAAPERSALEARTFDDTYAGGPVWGLEGGGRLVEVVQDEGFPVTQLFAPAEADVVSIEPMCAITDALSGAGDPSRATLARAAFSIRVTSASVATG